MLKEQGVAIRYQLGTVDHNWSIAYRFGIAALTMYVLARRYGAPVLVRRDELPLERLYRLVRIFTLVEGTSEIQKYIIAKTMGL